MSVLNLAQLSDDELRAALFDALLERIDAQAREDASITVVNRMPTVFAVARHGNLLTVSQGLGLPLLRGDLRWKDRRERLRTFTVGRATNQSRLAVTPDRFEGTPDEVLDWIVATLLAWTAEDAGSRPASAEPVAAAPPTPVVPLPAPRARPRSGREETRGPARGPQNRRTAREPHERQVPAAPPPPADRPAEAPAVQERRSPIGFTPSTPVEVIQETTIAAPIAGNAIESEAAAPLPPPTPPVSLPPLRTYQLLFVTAQRELEQAKALPAGAAYALIAAGVFVAFTAEAFVNDLGSRVIPSWSQLQRLDPREKAEVLNIELFNDKVDWSVRPFQSVAAAFGFRRALAHAHAETLPFDEVQTGARRNDEVPRTRRTAWQERCDVATIQQWVADVHRVIEQFSRAHAD